jgi:ABC-2 type transport system ATP-binding protein
MSKNAIQVKNLYKSFGKVKVLKGVNLRVEKGSILALLGPNGAGKTTTIRILSTLIRPDKGQASVDGYDVVNESGRVRSSIGLTGQFAAVDEYLTGRENLVMMGRLYRLSNADAQSRADELLKEFDLVEASTRPVKTYSGGMKRRIDLAMSIIASPPVIILDEPTTGLDPRSRQTMWETIKRLVKGGTTILLTTQYMEEADYLADYVVVIDEGKVIAEGTTDQLKAKIGSERIEFTFSNSSGKEKAQKVLGNVTELSDDQRNTISISNDGGVKKLKYLLEKLESNKIKVEGINLHKPTLDDVFLTLTGRSTTKDNSDDVAQKKGSK